MFRRLVDNLRKFDWVLLVATVLLFCLGLAAIYSVSLSQEQSDLTDFNKQVIFGLIGFTVLFFVGFSNYASLRVYSRFLFVGVMGLLIGVLFFGTVIRGTKGWFNLFGFGFQPVELAKIVIIIMLAKFFSNRLQQFKVHKHILVSFFIFLILAVPVLLQPDLGSTLVMGGIWFIVLLLTGIDKKYIIILLILMIFVSSFAWGFMLKDYQKGRIMAFLDPQADPLGTGYNVSQAIIGIGSGRFFGRGLGFGSQSQLKFIPEAQTDFIFAVLAEELGLFGVFLVLGFWGLIFYRLLRIAKQAKNDFGQFLVLGIMSLFFIHIVVNVGMNLGVMPVMGISLPLLSYGGSFLVVTLGLIGIAESVAVRK
jgi:rod shape determining protein RodA